ncbi:unnamed protein product [Haemonchus placei]|uniref:Uncharacterized protein n=1 Tax=Haemonchus placei TaxID=6290 RepID=A0A3P7WX90_HAEPC|nr:unnamed protein product [Haemonchus placei]
MIWLMIWTLCLIPLVMCQISRADSMVNVTAAACTRNPELQYCKGPERMNDGRDDHRKVLFDRLKRMELDRETSHVGIRAHDTPLAEEDRIWLSKIAEAVERYKRDPFSDIESTKAPEKTNSTSHNDSDLREKETGGNNDQEPEEGFIREEDHSSHRHLKEKETHVHVEEDADESHVPRQIEETEESPRTREKGEGYCDQYEQHFSFYCIGDIDHTGQHEETISKFCPAYKAACPHKKIASSVSLTAWPRNPFKKKVYLRVPVEESGSSSYEEDSEEEELTAEEEEEERKAAYYKELKYARYHYASQYIYSKAEKGKTVPGPHTTNPNPYNIPTGGIPSPPLDSVRLAAGRPTQEELYADNPQSLRPLAQSSNTVVIPPPLPASAKRDFTERTPYTEKRRRTGTERNVRKSQHESTYRAMSSRELYRTLRAQQASTHPVVPSDASLGEDNTFKQFDGLTDSAGILHRPRSRSPFTKPGLWEPNPDDPHNRDHSNKFFYYPRSVTADWLNGQIAWGAHWAVPAAGVGGTDGFSTVHFPTIGTFLNIPDDYD